MLYWQRLQIKELGWLNKGKLAFNYKGNIHKGYYNPKRSLSNISGDTEFYTLQPTNVKMSISVLSKHQIPEDSKNQQACLAAWWDTRWALSLSGKQQNILKALPLKRKVHLQLHQAEGKLPPGLSQTCENLELPHNLCQRALSFHLYGPHPAPFLQQQKQLLARPQQGKSPTRIRNGCLKPLEISFMDTLLQERNAIN